jgi:hypothetical protein
MSGLSSLKMTTVALLGIALFVAPASAQTAKDLVGAWTLVSDENVRPDGSRVQAMGLDPQGLLIFVTVQSRPASCLGAPGSRSKFNVPLGVESQGFCLLG